MKKTTTKFNRPFKTHLYGNTLKEKEKRKTS